MYIHPRPFSADKSSTRLVKRRAGPPSSRLSVKIFKRSVIDSSQRHAKRVFLSIDNSQRCLKRVLRPIDNSQRCPKRISYPIDSSQRHLKCILHTSDCCRRLFFFRYPTYLYPVVRAQKQMPRESRLQSITNDIIPLQSSSVTVASRTSPPRGG